VLSLEEAITLGVLMSLSLYLSRTSRPQVRERAPAPHNAERRLVDAEVAGSCPQLRFVRIDGSLFFGATWAARRLGWSASGNPAVCRECWVDQPSHCAGFEVEPRFLG
jgi:hypothetical protein